MFAYSFELSRLFCDVSAFYLSALVTFPQNFNLIYYSSVPPLQPFEVSGPYNWANSSVSSLDTNLSTPSLLL